MTNPRRHLPPLPHPENLRKQAKSRLGSLRARQSSARLAEAQHIIAREYGFPNWAALLAEVMRRHESPAGRYAAIRRQPLALRLESLEDDPEPVHRFFLAGAGAAAILTIVIGIGLAPVLWAVSQGVPFHAQHALALIRSFF